jgi:hypothetical protein
MGYRTLSSPTIINLKEELPLIPRKIKKIKLIVQQKIDLVEKEELDDIPKSTVNMFKQINGFINTYQGSSYP